jgi:lipopolysaccharide transport system ATP-binding protein
MLDEGRIVSMGTSKEVVEKYLSEIFSPVNNQDLRHSQVRSGDGRLQFVSARLYTGNGSPTTVPVSGGPLNIVLGFESRQSLSHVRFILTIFNQMGIAVTHCNVQSTGQHFFVRRGEGQVLCRIPRLPLPLGQYKISAAAFDDVGKLDWVPTVCIFNVETSNFFKTSFVPPMRYSTALVEHSWELLPNWDAQ